MIAVRPGETRPIVVELPAGYSGEVGLRVEDADDNIVVARSTTGFTEFADGRMRKTVTFPTEPGVVYAIADLDDGRESVEEYQVGETLEGLSSRLTASRITVSTPVAEDGTIQLIAGDDYQAADGRSIDFTHATWPDLTAATVTLRAGIEGSEPELEIEGAVLLATGPTKQIRFEVTAAETADLSTAPDPRGFEIVADLPSTRTVTLVRGILRVRRRLG